MEQNCHWYGPNDLATLADIRQAGVIGMVTALRLLRRFEELGVLEFNMEKSSVIYK